MALDSGRDYLFLDGLDDSIQTLKSVVNGELRNCFIEIAACHGNCVGGLAFRQKHTNLLESRRRVIKSAGGGKNFDIQEPVDMRRVLVDKKHPTDMPPESVINGILRKMGKFSPADELNCGLCGYRTCRDKAIAVYEGRAEISMCMPYMKERAETFSGYVINNTPNAIFVLDENLCVQQINKAGCALFNLKTPSDILGSPIVRLLNPADYLGVMTSGVPIKEKKHYLAEYKKYVAETIVYDHEYHIVFSIMRDITSEEERQSERSELCNKTVAITNEVIEKQMRVVQEIASLLGETTAETKIALTQLKDALQK